MEKIEVRNLNFSYDEKKLFVDFSASYPAKKCGIIMGESGCGKTTFLYLMTGLIRKMSGEIIYPITHPRFAFVFQDDRLIDSINVKNNIKLVNNKLKDSDIKACLEHLNIIGTMNKKVRSLSGGERKRVAIARALLSEYDVLFMDEPFSALDKDNKENVMNYVKEKIKDKTVLIVTHDMEEAEKMGDNIYYL